MFGRMRTSLLILFIIGFASLFYCQGNDYRSLPLPPTAELSGALSGLNLPGYESAACAAAQPASTSVPCFPVDPQSVAHGLAATDPIAFASLSHETPTLWPRLPVAEDVLISVDVLIAVFALIFTWCLVLVVRNKTGQFSASRSRQRGHSQEIIVETAVVSLAVTMAPSLSRNLASHSHASSPHPRASIFLPHASVSENSVRWQLGLIHDGPYSGSRARNDRENRSGGSPLV